MSWFLVSESEGKTQGFGAKFFLDDYSIKFLK